MFLHTLFMLSLCSYIFCLGEAFLLKKVLQTNGCARRALKNMLKAKDLSLFLVADLYFTSPGF